MNRNKNFIKLLLPLLFLFAYVLYSIIIRKYALAHIEDSNVIFAQTILKLIGVLLLFGYVFVNFKSLLQSDWDKFRKRSIAKYLWIVLSWLGIVIVLNLTRSVIGLVAHNPIIPNWNPIKYIDEYGSSVMMDSVVQVIIVFTSLIVVMPKEIILRHCVFMSNVQSNPTVLRLAGFALLSSLLTGVTYLSINSTFLACIPYMASSLVLSLLYWQTRNIWYSLITHFMFVIIGLVCNYTGIFLTIYLA